MSLFLLPLLSPDLNATLCALPTVQRGAKSLHSKTVAPDINLRGENLEERSIIRRPSLLTTYYLAVLKALDVFNFFSRPAYFGQVRLDLGEKSNISFPPFPPPLDLCMPVCDVRYAHEASFFPSPPPVKTTLSSSKIRRGWRELGVRICKTRRRRKDDKWMDLCTRKETARK